MHGLEDVDLSFDDGGDEEILISQEDNRIHTSSGDLEIESLHNKKKKGKLVLQPDFQRQ